MSMNERAKGTPPAPAAAVLQRVLVAGLSPSLAGDRFAQGRPRTEDSLARAPLVFSAGQKIANDLQGRTGVNGRG